MKIAAVLCLMVAGTMAVDCNAPHPSFFTKLLCGVETLGHSLLESLKEPAIQLATSLGGSLVTELQNVGQQIAHTNTSQLVAELGIVGKRDIDLATMIKAAAFVEAHKQEVDEMINLIHKVTNFTLDKVDGLVKHFQNNPTAQDLEKIYAFLQAHNIIQNEIMAYIQKNGSPLTALVAQELISHLPHKRSLSSLLSSVGSALSSTLSPVVETVNSLVGGLGGQLLSTLGTLAPVAGELVQSFVAGGTPVGSSGLASAVGEILHGVLAEHSPTLSSILTTVGTSLLG